MKLLLIDNNDSFTYNIVDMLRKIDYINLDIVASQKLYIESLFNYEKIIISPGPAKPKNYPALEKTIAYCINNSTPLLGICLGHQAICCFFGGKLIQLKEVVHGRQKTVYLNNNSLIYNGLPPKIEVGLYHSWAIEVETLPNCLEITGTLANACLMSVEHKIHPIYGLQFHPESFLTTYGLQILKNFLAK